MKSISEGLKSFTIRIYALNGGNTTSKSFRMGHEFEPRMLSDVAGDDEQPQFRDQTQGIGKVI
jgi:hypothetical protein